MMTHSKLTFWVVLGCTAAGLAACGGSDETVGGGGSGGVSYGGFTGNPFGGSGATGSGATGSGADTSSGATGAGADTGSGATGAGTGVGSGGTPSVDAPMVCGDGIFETGEDCDGTLGLNNSNCATVTMGSRASGTLSCSPTCHYNASDCTSNGNPSGSGGGTGTGGGFGTGGGP